MRFTAADSGCAGMMHYCMGSDSTPDRIDAIRRLLADDLDLAEVLGGREMRRTSRSASPAPVTRHRPSEKLRFGPQGTKRSTSFQGTPATHHEFDQGALIMSSNLCDDLRSTAREHRKVTKIACPGA